MTPTFSVIVATGGRSSLVRALRSVAEQPILAPDLGLQTGGDEILVVGEAAPFILGAVAATPGARHVLCPRGNNWGHAERNHAMKSARGSHLVFLDDDDVYLPGAFAAMRSACQAHPDRPIMFRMITTNGGTLWVDRVVQHGNHGTPQFVVPNHPDRLGVWGSRYSGDFDFCTSTLAKYPSDALVWDPTVTYQCRPPESEELRAG